MSHPVAPLPGPGTLRGWDVAVTSARRGTDLVALLEQRGARVLHVPAVRTVPLEDDLTQRRATTEALSGPIDIVVATTGVGFGAWLQAADGWGLGEDLRRALTGARLYARGPKARGAVHEAGLQDAAVPPCESSWDVLERLLADDLTGSRAVVQLHGAAIDDFTRTLGRAGAEVVEVPVYRSAPPDEDAVLERLVVRLLARELHAVTFTSASATTNVLDAATRLGALDDLLSALRHDVLPGCVGPVAAAPLHRLSVPAVLPAQSRLGALAHSLTTALERRAVQLRVAGHALEVRGSGAVLDDGFRPLAPAPMAALTALAGAPGRVLSRDQLQKTLPTGGDQHAVEMAISRLRAGLGDAACVRNVVKRGYRLAVDAVPPATATPPPTRAPAPLLQSVGGTPGIREAVELLYARLLAEPLVAHFFADVDMPRLKRHQVLLLSQLLGGPAAYTGRELSEAHAGMSLTAEHYRCVLDHLVTVLQELGVDDDAVRSVAGALESLEPDVLGERAAVSAR